MLNRSPSIYLSFMMLAAPGMYAAQEQIVAGPNDAASLPRQAIKFKYAEGSRCEQNLERMRPVCVGTGPIPTSSASSEPVREFDLTVLPAGVPLVHRFAQSTNPFWRSFGIALGFSTTWVASGLYLKLTPEQVAKIAACASCSFVAWGVGTQIFRYITRSTGYNPDSVRYNRECQREIQIARGHQMLGLATILNDAKPTLGSDLSSEEIHNNNLLPAALERVRTDDYHTTTLFDRVRSNLERRNLASSVGYVVGGAAGLALAHSLKRLAQ